jgi:hypothetical protein
MLNIITHFRHWLWSLIYTPHSSNIDDSCFLHMNRNNAVTLEQQDGMLRRQVSWLRQQKDVWIKIESLKFYLGSKLQANNSMDHRLLFCPSVFPHAQQPSIGIELSSIPPFPLSTDPITLNSTNQQENATDHDKTLLCRQPTSALACLLSESGKQISS